LSHSSLRGSNSPLFLVRAAEIIYLAGVLRYVLEAFLGHIHRDRSFGLTLLLNRCSLVEIKLVDGLVPKIGERCLLPKILERLQSVIDGIRRRDGGGW
jgi:hypothetical protein